jgi:tetratricopeptide (TPR) repeat protein
LSKIVINNSLTRISKVKNKTKQSEETMTSLNNVTDNFEKGMVAFAGQNYTESIDLLSEVINADGNHRLAIAARGAARLKMGQSKEAISDFNKTLEVDPDYARAYHLRGLAWEAEGDDEKALLDFGKAIEKSPEYGVAYYSRATLLTKMGRTDDAESDIQMVTRLTNQNIETFANDHNLWRSQQMRVESILETELNR